MKTALFKTVVCIFFIAQLCALRAQSVDTRSSGLNLNNDNFKQKKKEIIRLIKSAGDIIELGKDKPFKNMQELKYHPDTVITYSDISGDSKIIFQYDNDGKVLTETGLIWENNGWVNEWRDSYTYDGNGNNITILEQIWDNGWIDDKLNTCTFDANGNMLTRLRQTWILNAWQDLSLTTWTYDGNGNKLTSTGQGWGNIIWVNEWMFSYTYDGNNNMLSELQQNWENNAWVNDFYVLFTYDGNNYMTSMTLQDWVSDSWEYKNQYTYTYDFMGNMLTSLEEKWEANAWVNNWLMTNTYDGNGNQLTELDQMWNNNSWVNDWMIIYTWNGSDNIVEMLGQYWDNGNWMDDVKIEYEYVQGNIVGSAYQWSGGSWDPYDFVIEIVYLDESLSWSFGCYKVEVFYSSYLGEEEYFSLPSPSFSVFPNPTADKLNVIYESIQEESLSISIYDISGQLLGILYQDDIQPGRKTIQLDTQELKQGLYFLEIKTGNYCERQKVIVCW